MSISIGDIEARLTSIAGERPIRFLEFAAVGATGMVVDLAITTTALDLTHYLAANLLGFIVAVSWNFAGNWLFVFDRPDGSLVWQYSSYVALHAVTFLIRAVVLTGLIEAGGVAPLPATVVGVGAAAVANYFGTERILEDDIEWFDAVAAVNSAAHRVYSSRLRTWLRRTGLYGLAYGAYMRLLSLLYRDDILNMDVRGVSAKLYTERSPEIVSAFHTLEKEDEALDAFIGRLETEMTVWDVGANIGIYSVLAGDVASEVVGFEPVPATADRLEENLELNETNGVGLNVALAAETGEMELQLERDEVGTQTPALEADRVASTSAVTVQTITGDQLVSDGMPAPDAIKIDVEGAEVAVLAGLEETLPEVDRIFVETHDGTAGEVSQRLQRAGFDVRARRYGGQSYFWGER